MSEKGQQCQKQLQKSSVYLSYDPAPICRKENLSRLFTNCTAADKTKNSNSSPTAGARHRLFSWSIGLQTACLVCSILRDCNEGHQRPSEQPAQHLCGTKVKQVHGESKGRLVDIRTDRLTFWTSLSTGLPCRAVSRYKLQAEFNRE